ncbi:hypothetical protein JCM8097_008355 [Rhodosporidiobolus ruineniae]
MPLCSKTLRWQREVDSDSGDDILAPENDRFSPEPLSGTMITARQASNRYYVESEDLMELGFDFDQAEYPLEVVEEYRRYRDKLSRQYWAATRPKPPGPAQTSSRKRKQQQADLDPALPSSPEKKPKTRWQDTPQGAAAVVRLHGTTGARG